MTELLAFLGSLAVAWLLFAFVAESKRPFRRPGSRLSRRRWRFGRQLAGAWLAGVCLAWLAWLLLDVSTGAAAGILVAVLLLLGVPATMAFGRRGGRAHAGGTDGA